MMKKSDVEKHHFFLVSTQNKKPSDYHYASYFLNFNPFKNKGLSFLKYVVVF